MVVVVDVLLLFCRSSHPPPRLSITRTPHLPFYLPSRSQARSQQPRRDNDDADNNNKKPHQQSQNPHLRIGSTSGHTTLPSWVDRRQKECIKISQQVGTKGKEIRGLIRRGKEGFSASNAGDNAKYEITARKKNGDTR